jgi:hypothetical protein
MVHKGTAAFCGVRASKRVTGPRPEPSWTFRRSGPLSERSPICGTTNFLPSSGRILQKDTSCKSCRRKAILFTHQHNIKGSSPGLPFATANEHLCMQVAAKVTESAKTELSQAMCWSCIASTLMRSANSSGQWKTFARRYTLGKMHVSPPSTTVNLMPCSEGLPAVMNGILLKFEREFPGAMPIQEIATEVTSPDT